MSEKCRNSNASRFARSRKLIPAEGRVKNAHFLCDGLWTLASARVAASEPRPHSSVACEQVVEHLRRDLDHAAEAHLTRGQSNLVGPWVWFPRHFPNHEKAGVSAGPKDGSETAASIVAAASSGFTSRLRRGVTPRGSLRIGAPQPGPLRQTWGSRNVQPGQWLTSSSRAPRHPLNPLTTTGATAGAPSWTS